MPRPEPSMLPRPVGPAIMLPPMFCTVDRPRLCPRPLLTRLRPSMLPSPPLSRLAPALSSEPKPPPAPAAPVPAEAAPENPRALVKAPAMGLTMAWITGRSTMLRNRPLMYSHALLPPCIRASLRDWPIWSAVRCQSRAASSAALALASMTARSAIRPRSFWRASISRCTASQGSLPSW